MPPPIKLYTSADRQQDRLRVTATEGVLKSLVAAIDGWRHHERVGWKEVGELAPWFTLAAVDYHMSLMSLMQLAAPAAGDPDLESVVELNWDHAVFGDRLVRLAIAARDARHRLGRSL
jgi:hypothetical protein